MQVVNRTSDRSGSASEDNPAERGCSRLRTTLGSTSTMPGGSHMTASLGGHYDPWPVKRSTDWLTDSLTQLLLVTCIRGELSTRCWLLRPLRRSAQYMSQLQPEVTKTSLWLLQTAKEYMVPPYAVPQAALGVLQLRTGNFHTTQQAYQH